ncbi:7833_t:CDS:2, partial [Funneliformis caledonium]
RVSALNEKKIFQLKAGTSFLVYDSWKDEGKINGKAKAFEVNVRWFTKKSTNERDKHQNDLESFSRMDPRKRDEYIETFG